MNKNILSASILSADFSRLGEEIHQSEKSGIDWIHIDVMDGHFVPNITMGPFIVETCKRITALPLDVHLMIDNSDEFAEKFINAGASNVSIHFEKNPKAIETLKKIRSSGAHPGIVINPDTDGSVLGPFLPYVDMILVMTVFPGYSGQEFIPQTISKIKTVREMIDSLKLDIRLEVDGGMNSQTIHQCAQAGADTFVAASAIFKYGEGIDAGVKALRDALK
jgi:ribulose-phosphate 3-epimerase